MYVIFLKWDGSRGFIRSLKGDFSYDSSDALRFDTSEDAHAAIEELHANRGVVPNGRYEVRHAPKHRITFVRSNDGASVGYFYSQYRININRHVIDNIRQGKTDVKVERYKGN